MKGLRVHGLVAAGTAIEGLELPPGRILCVHGPSGSGKTRLLRAIADLDPNRAEVWLDGRPREAFSPAEWRRRVMLVPAVPGWWAETPRPHASEWPAAWMAALSLEPTLLDRPVERLSSGERARLALLRALVRRPRVLLLDEPTAHLDAAASQRVEALIEEVREQHGTAVLWVTHDAAQRARIADLQLPLGEPAP